MREIHSDIHDCVNAEKLSKQSKSSNKNGECWIHKKCEICGRDITFYFPDKNNEPNNFDYYNQ